jgi:hypothetical protein
MTADTLLRTLEMAGAKVSVRGERLHIEAPTGLVTPDLLDAMRQAKPELLALLAGSCRPPAPVFAESDDGRCRLLHCGVDQIAAHLPPDSVDAIITDPPYPRKFVPLFGHLARGAATLLRPWGARRRAN